MAKLTLSIEPNKIEKAKIYAAKHHTSISKIVSDFLTDITAKEETTEDPFLQQLKQMKMPDWINDLSVKTKVNLPDNVDYKDLKYGYLKEKYGL
jgi:hypothetical protein